MAWRLKRPFKKLKEEETLESASYLDLGEFEFGVEAVPEGATLKLAEVARYEDVKSISSYIYKGHIMIIDYTPICNDELTLKRITSELKSVIKDTQGDMAGIGKNMLVITPPGIKIDRTKLKPSY
jgi:hypothetical protein